jgi:Fe-S oxidoreductase
VTSVRPEAKSASAAVEKFLALTDAAVASYLEACVHCGECAEACHFYLVTEDPKYTPTHKLRPMARAYRRHKAPFAPLKRALGLAPSEVTEAELEEWAPLVYDSCTLCGRCTVVCPMGIDIAGAIRKMREGMTAGGFAPADLYKAADLAIATGSPLGVREKALRKTIEIQEKKTGIPVPLDRKGADYLVILSAMEIVGFPGTIGALAKLFRQAGISWTISTKTFEATNVGIQMGSREVAATLVGRVAAVAEELGVKYVISPECGHAYGALKWEGPNLIGRAYAFEVVHIVELLARLLKEGRIRARGRDPRRLTFHDPCQLVRRGGLVEEPRAVLRAVAPDFVEMKNAGPWNVCCGGGGGVSTNSRAEPLRLAAFRCKKDQVDELGGIEAMVTACANCRNVMEEAIEHYGMDLPIVGLGELLADYLEPPA